MNRITLIALCLFLSIKTNSQSWIVEENNKGFVHPIEWDNGNIFVCTFTFSEDSSKVNYELRMSDGSLLKNTPLFKPGIGLSLSKNIKFNNNILNLVNGYSKVNLKNSTTIQLIDENLNIEFENTKDLIGYPHRNDICIESDSTVLILINAESLINEVDSTYFIRITNKGTILKQNSYYKKFGDLIKNIINNPLNDSIILLGTHEVFTLDTNFHPNYWKTLPFYNGDAWGSILKYRDTSFLWLVRIRFENSSRLADIGLIKFDSNFDTVKTIQLGEASEIELSGTGEFRNPKAKNSIYMSGIKDSPPLQIINVPIIISRLDTNLNVIWTKYYDNNRRNYLPNIHATADDGVLISGWGQDILFPDSTPIGYLMKLDSIGNFPTSTIENYRKLLWSATVFPNPSPGNLSIKIDDTQKDLKLELYDENGCIVYQSKSMRSGQHHFDLSFLTPGIYFYSIFFDGKEKARGKWIRS
jgi:hypothetical protein